MLKPGKTPRQLIEDTVKKNRKKRKTFSEEMTSDSEDIHKLIEIAVASPCRDEIFTQAITEARWDSKKSTVDCLKIAIAEWDK